MENVNQYNLNLLVNHIKEGFQLNCGGIIKRKEIKNCTSRVNVGYRSLLTRVLVTQNLFG